MNSAATPKPRAVLITIGHAEFYLPSDKGLAAVVSTLSRARRCEDNTYLSSRAQNIVLLEFADVRLKYINPATVIEDASKSKSRR